MLGIHPSRRNTGSTYQIKQPGSATHVDNTLLLHGCKSANCDYQGSVRIKQRTNLRVFLGFATKNTHQTYRYWSTAIYKYHQIRPFSMVTWQLVIVIELEPWITFHCRWGMLQNLRMEPVWIAKVKRWLILMEPTISRQKHTFSGCPNFYTYHSTPKHSNWQTCFTCLLSGAAICWLHSSSAGAVGNSFWGFIKNLDVRATGHMARVCPGKT